MKNVKSYLQNYVL